MARTVVSEEDRMTLKAIALEICAIRKLINKLAEALVNLSDKELLKIFEASNEDTVKERQLDRCEAKLDRQLDILEKEFRS